VPATVNTDGWSATQRAWLNLFPMIILIECFLHAFIKIREQGKHLMVIEFTEIKNSSTKFRNRSGMCIVLWTPSLFAPKSKNSDKG